MKYPSETTCVIQKYSLTPNTNTNDYEIQSSETEIAIKTET